MLGRLTVARYAAHSPGSTKWDAEVSRYDVPQISYDQNGNLTQMTQHGWRPGSVSFGMIDDLRYTETCPERSRRNGNQLQAVRDQSTQHGDKDFQDNGATSFQEEQAELELVTYDARGSMTADANLGITAVTYNHLGLTETVTLMGGRQLRYLYAADGTRLARVRVQPGQADLRDDLVGAFAYQGGALNHILNGEGRIVPAVSPGRQYRHEYHYRDQLGNLRLAFSDLNNNGVAEVGDILQEAHFYPYGLGFSGMAVVSNGVPSRYTFNGKEAQEAFGMGWMDFGARMYDAQVGRWMAVDALADKTIAYSPYHFVYGNPIGFFDPDGNMPTEGGDPEKRKVSASAYRTIAFGLEHPIAALEIGMPVIGRENISSRSVRFSTRLGLVENETNEASQVNAFRHTLWQATIANELGWGIAKEIGDAHENDPFAHEGFNPERDLFKNLSQADQTADLLNNEIGRAIGSNLKSHNMQELSITILEYYHDWGLWKAEAINGQNEASKSYRLVKEKLGENQYYEAKSILKTLHPNGNNSFENYQKEKAAQESAKSDRVEMYISPKF
jgi:RHS repeat-associated protein